MHPLEHELHELVQDSRLIDLFERAVDGFWIWDLTKDGTSWVTPSFSRVFGYKPGEFEQGASFWKSICHPDDWAAAMNAAQQAIATHGVYDHVARFRHKDGQWRWGRSVGLIVYDDTGLPVRAFGLQHNVSELMEAKTLLEKETRHDPLTGLLNRRGIHEALARTIDQVDRLRCEAYAVLIDLDDFKAVNDKYGHAAGDDVLAQTAACIQNSVRVVDEVGRLGGDEFLVFLLARNRTEAEFVADRIAACIRTMQVEYEGHTIDVTISAALLPLYCADCARIDRLETLLKFASPYLRRSKQNGKDQTASASVHPPAID